MFIDFVSIFLNKFVEFIYCSLILLLFFSFVLDFITVFLSINRRILQDIDKMFL